MVACDQRDELHGEAHIPGNCLHEIDEGAPRHIGLGIKLPVILSGGAFRKYDRRVEGGIGDLEGPLRLCRSSADKDCNARASKWLRIFTGRLPLACSLFVAREKYHAGGAPHVDIGDD
jgi:hypothetical protein